MNPELVSLASVVNSLLTGLLIILVVISLLEFLRALLRAPATRWPILDQSRGSSFALLLALLLAVIVCAWLEIDIFYIAFRTECTYPGKVLTGLVLGQSAFMLYRLAPPCYPRSVSATTVTPKDQK